MVHQSDKQREEWLDANPKLLLQSPLLLSSPWGLDWQVLSQQKTSHVFAELPYLDFDPNPKRAPYQIPSFNNNAILRPDNLLYCSCKPHILARHHHPLHKKVKNLWRRPNITFPPPPLLSRSFSDPTPSPANAFFHRRTDSYLGTVRPAGWMDDGSGEGWNLEWGSVLHVTDGRTGRHSEFIYKIFEKKAGKFLRCFFTMAHPCGPLQPKIK